MSMYQKCSVCNSLPCVCEPEDPCDDDVENYTVADELWESNCRPILAAPDEPSNSR